MFPSGLDPRSMQWQEDGDLDPADLAALMRRLQAIDGHGLGHELQGLGVVQEPSD
ncbi:MAG: hypothetical protein ACON4T_00120 [Synechococcus sp.]